MKFNIDNQNLFNEESFVIIWRIRSFYVEQCDILSKYNKNFSKFLFGLEIIFIEFLGTGEKKNYQSEGIKC